MVLYHDTDMCPPMFLPPKRHVVGLVEAAPTPVEDAATRQLTGSRDSNLVV